MKVVYTVASIGNESAGPSYSVSRLAANVASFADDVSLLACKPEPTGSFAFRGRYFDQASINIGRMAFSPDLHHGLLDECMNADILHANALWMMPMVYPGWVRKRCPNCKLVWSPRGAMAQWTLDKSKWQKKIFGALLQWPAVRQADMFHATSMKEYEEIRQLGFRQPVALLPIGIDVPVVDKAKAKAGAKMRKIVFFGRLHAVKKVDDILLAWEQVHNEMPDWEVQIAGPDFGVEADLRNLVASHNLPRVTFVGELKGQAKYDFLASADLCLLPSLTENFGITVAESLVCETPVIASQGTPWSGLNDNNCGWWVPNGADAIAKAFREAVAKSPEEMTTMGLNGKAWMMRDFAWPSIGRNMLTAYEWLLGEADKPDFVIED